MISPASALLWSFAGGEGTTSTAETEEQPVIAVDSGEAIVLVMPSRSVGIWKDES